MIYDKPATTIDDQITLLRSRGMHVPDRDRAAHYLRHIGYYRLSAYWLPFEEPSAPDCPRTHRFRQGTTFEDVLNRYVFYRKLRLLVTEALERIEVSVRSCWSSALACRHGPHAHMNARLFACPFWHLRQLSQLARETRKSSETFVEHYRQKYSEPFLPPIWMVAETMSFGTLSRWVEKTSDATVQLEIIDHLDFPNREILHKTLHVLTYLRNICAHHGRLWNRRFIMKYPRIKRLPALVDPAAGHEAARYIFNHLFILKVLMVRINPRASWPDRLCELLGQQNVATLQAMMLPNDWRNPLSRPSEEGT